MKGRASFKKSNHKRGNYFTLNIYFLMIANRTRAIIPRWIYRSYATPNEKVAA